MAAGMLREPDKALVPPSQGIPLKVAHSSPLLRTPPGGSLRSGLGPSCVNPLGSQRTPASWKCALEMHLFPTFLFGRPCVSLGQLFILPWASVSLGVGAGRWSHVGAGDTGSCPGFLACLAVVPKLTCSSVVQLVAHSPRVPSDSIVPGGFGQWAVEEVMLLGKVSSVGLAQWEEPPGAMQRP